MPPDDEYIWVNRWDEFQTFQTKRGKPWVPPWIKVYPRLLDDAAYLDLPPETRCLLEGIWKLFASSRLTLPKDTRYLSRRLNQRVLTRQLERLNNAGWITFCSRTVLEQRRNMFWNCSALEEEEDVDREGTSLETKVYPNSPRPQAAGVYAEELARLAATNGNGTTKHETDEPYFDRLLNAVGNTEQNFAKLRRAARGQPTAAIIAALEAANAPTTREPIAVALTVLSTYGQEPAPSETNG